MIQNIEPKNLINKTNIYAAKFVIYIYVKQFRYRAGVTQKVPRFRDNGTEWW